MQTILDTLPWFHFRLHSDASKEFMINQLKEMGIHMYVGGYEIEAKRNHWQLSIHTYMAEAELRALLKSTFKPDKSSYSLSKKRKTLKQLATYLLKEGNSIHCGLPTEYVETLKKLVFKSSSKSREQFYKLDDKFLTDDDFTYQLYIRDFQQLKLDHRQTGNDQTLLRRLDMLLQRRDPKYKKLRANQIIHNFEQFFLGTN